MKLRVKLRVKLCVKPCVKLRVKPCVKLRVSPCVKLRVMLCVKLRVKPGISQERRRREHFGAGNARNCCSSLGFGLRRKRKGGRSSASRVYVHSAGFARKKMPPFHSPVGAI